MLPAVEGDALAHADEAVPAARGAWRAAGAVVDDLELERVGAVRDAHGGVRMAGVLERVRERLLHDPVGGELEPDGQVARLAIDLAARPAGRPRVSA